MIPGDEHIEIPVGPGGRNVLAAVAIAYHQMMLQAPSGATFIGLALASQPTEAIVARLDSRQARKLGLELIQRANALEQNGKVLMPGKGGLILPGGS